MALPAPALRTAVDSLELALEQRDQALLNEAFGQLHHAMGGASAAEQIEQGPRLAAAVGAAPLGASAFLAVMTGACVEAGADPAECARPVLGGVYEALRDAARFPALWEATVGGELPERDHQEMDGVLDRLAEATGGMDGETFAAASAWTQLGMWEMAAVALLSHEKIRRAVREEGGLVEAGDEAAQGEADLKCLRYLLKMLDGEELVVLHRPSATGYRVRLSGIGDNFQLHVLLAHVLVGGGYVAGEAPAADLVAAMKDAPVVAEVPLATGAFNMVGADGRWIWNEGCPADIPVVDGERVLVLDPPPYARSWRAPRFYPQIEGDVVLVEVLPPAVAAGYLAKAAPPR